MEFSETNERRTNEMTILYILPTHVHLFLVIGQRKLAFTRTKTTILLCISYAYFVLLNPRYALNSMKEGICRFIGY